MSYTELTVTCIMPTRDRRRFVERAIDYFLRQDYPRRELIIVDDGYDSVADLAAVDPLIRYFQLDQHLTIGAKRNMACAEAKGEIIVHWDDDDWMADWRISYQVTHLLRRRADICGLSKLFYYDLNSKEAWQYIYRQRNDKPWVAGNTLCYLRAFWLDNPFLNLSLGEDTHFIWSSHPKKVSTSRRSDFFIALIHGDNAAPKRPDGFWHSFPPVRLQRWMGKDYQFYLDILKNKTNVKEENNRHLEKTNSIQVLPPKPSQKPLVTACLLSWKRPNNLQPIVELLHQHDFIDEILVWNNNPAVKLNLHGERVQVITSPENFICYGRYLCARQARNDIIYFQDDDTLVDNVPTLYQAFLNDSNRIVHALSEQHYPHRERSVYPFGHNALLGWGSFLRKEWLQILEGYIARCGTNNLLRREADKIFTLLLERRHMTLPAKIRQLSDHSSPGIAMYLDNEYRLMEALAVREALEHLRLSKSVPYPVTWNVVITSYNYGHFLEEAVQSVLLNDADYAITIVDDASTDNTSSIANQFSKRYSHVSYIRHEKNMGVGYTRNNGIAAVDSLFVVALDADDKIGPNYLYEAERLLSDGADVVNPDAILFGVESDRWKVPDHVNLPMLLDHNIVHCVAAFRRSDWAQIRGVEEDMHSWEDYDFWVRLAAAGARIRRLPGDHFFYRKHSPSKSENYPQMMNEQRSFIRNKHRDLF